MKRFLFLMLSSILFSCSNQAQTNNHSTNVTAKLQQASVDVNRSLAKLTNWAEKKDIEYANKAGFRSFSARMDRISVLLFNCINSLEKVKWTVAGDTLLPKYVYEFENYSNLMAQATTINNYDSLHSLMDFIDEDLNLKYDGSFASSSGQDPGLVQVRVRVVDPSGNQDLAGYNVFVKPERSVDQRLVEAFNPTNFAVKSILPGKKLIWIEKNGNKVDQRITGIRKSAGSEEVIVFIVNN